MNEYKQYRIGELQSFIREQDARQRGHVLTMPLTFNEIYIDRYPQYKTRYLSYDQDIDPIIIGSLAWRIVQNRQYIYAGAKGKSKCMPCVWHGRHMGFNDI